MPPYGVHLTWEMIGVTTRDDGILLRFLGSNRAVVAAPTACNLSGPWEKEDGAVAVVEVTPAMIRARRTRISAVYREVQGWFTHQGLVETLTVGDSQTEAIALEWLAKAGKRFRPFLVASLHLALRDDDIEDAVAEDVRLLAVALECIHKGSLIYDDIQDGDDCRYGAATVHSVYGMPVALTAALLLLGWGYRLIGRCRCAPARVAEMLTLAYQAHCDLCLGQGGELCWMRAPRALTPAEVLDLFRLKTAPSFAVVFCLPLMYHQRRDLDEMMRRFSITVGTAYQVQDDLHDFHGNGDVDDIAARRPSIVMAYAHQMTDGPLRQKVAGGWFGNEPLARSEWRRIIADSGAVAAAEDALSGLKSEARAILAACDNPMLRDLLVQVMETILGVDDPG